MEAKLSKAEAAFQSKENQDKYTKLNSQFEAAHDVLTKSKKELRDLRGQFLETEYYYTKTQQPEYKAKMDVLQRSIDAVGLRVAAQQKVEESIKGSLSALTAGTAGIRAEIENMKNGLEEKKEKIANNGKFPIEIKQIHIKDIDKADRCQSCHIGIDGKSQVSNKQPFTRHPASFVYLDHHDPAKFGCTFCHRGQGRATTSAEKAHGNVKHWDEPMLQGDMTQTSCLNCHGDIKNLRGAESIIKSTELIKKYGCYSCHKIPGYETVGDVGPVLTQVGTKVNYSWAINWLLDPKKYFATARMPKFYFTQYQAESLADYLVIMSVTTRQHGDNTKNKPDANLIQEAKA